MSAPFTSYIAKVSPTAHLASSVAVSDPLTWQSDPRAYLHAHRGAHAAPHGQVRGDQQPPGVFGKSVSDLLGLAVCVCMHVARHRYLQRRPPPGKPARGLSPPIYVACCSTAMLERVADLPTGFLPAATSGRRRLPRPPLQPTLPRQGESRWSTRRLLLPWAGCSHRAKRLTSPVVCLATVRRLTLPGNRPASPPPGACHVLTGLVTTATLTITPGCCQADASPHLHAHAGPDTPAHGKPPSLRGAVGPQRDGVAGVELLVQGLLAGRADGRGLHAAADTHLPPAGQQGTAGRQAGRHQRTITYPAPRCTRLTCWSSVILLARCRGMAGRR